MKQSRQYNEKPRLFLWMEENNHSRPMQQRTASNDGLHSNKNRGTK